MNEVNISKNNNFSKVLKILLVIFLIFVIAFSIIRIFSNSKNGEQRYLELQDKLCTAAKTYVSNNPSILDTTQPGEFATIKFQTLLDAKLIDKKIENPYYDGGLFKKSTVDKYYSMDNSILVILGNDGNLTCELVNKVGTISKKSSGNKIEVSPEDINVTDITLENEGIKISNGGACTTSKLYPGTILSLTAMITPNDATNKTVTWVSDDSNIATVIGQTDLNNSTMETIEKGLIIVRGEGTATITAIANDKATNCTLTISEQIIKCEAGTYLAKGESTCRKCPANSYCEGGSYTINLVSDSGKTLCPTGYISEAGSSECTKKEVIVTYHNNDGSDKTKVEKYAYSESNDNINQIKNIAVARNGYTFLGWSTNSNATEATYYENYKLDNDWINKNYPKMDLYAVWQKNSENGNSTVICKAGTYLAKGDSVCSICPVNSYCEGGNYTVKPSIDMGKNMCPNGYNSEKGATNISECYMNVNANEYVQNANDSSPTSCSKGYSSKEHIVYYGKISSCKAIELIPQSYELKGVAESSSDLCKNTEEAGYGCLVSNSTKDSVLTHNTKLLQNVIDAAASKASSNKIYTVNLPSGTYYFTKGGSKENLDYVIWLRNNINLIGKGNDDTKSNYTKLKTYGTSTKNFIPYGLTMLQNTNTDGKDILKNVRFEKFIIDGNDTRGLEYKGGGGKGIFISPCDNCHWDTVTIKNTDATGFGMDALMNSTIKNCVAINCGKNADISKHNGASGFGIGTQRFNEESVYIENCIAKDNKKFGFFFESQNRWGDSNQNSPFQASKSNGYVVRNCSASGNLHNYGGLRGSDVILINNTSTNPRSYHVFFSDDSRNTYVINMKINGKGFTDINQSHFAYNEIMWAQEMGINFGYNENKLITAELISERFTNNIKFDAFTEITRMEAVLSMWRMMNRPGKYITFANNNIYNNSSLHGNIDTGFKDVSNRALAAQAVLWAKQTGVTTGKTPDTFNPYDKITKGQFIVMLYRLAGKPNSDGNTEMEKAISWAKANKIVITDAPTNENLPRVRAIIMLYRYYQKYVNNTDYKKFKTYQNYVG